MKYAVVANPEKKDCVEFAIKIADEIGAVIEERTAKKAGRIGVPLDEIVADVIITVGGDGTILITLQHAKGRILGVNMGVLGFLTEIEPSEIKEAIEKIETGKYIIDRRMKIDVYHNDVKIGECVNEAVIHTSDIAKLRNYRVFFNDELMDEVRADGIIISTPTGSTSYALSAGGTIIHPSVEGLMVVPIAPFKYTIRSVVFPVGVIKVETMGHRNNVLVLDGQKYVDLSPGDMVRIKKSENYAEFIRFSTSVFRRIKNRAMLGR